MSGPNAAPPTLRSVRRDLAAAGGDQIARVVAMVDALAERGEADALVAPLRPRLSLFGVPRPLGFSRLLFTPLDGVLLDGPAWRRGGAGVPRTVLRSVSRAVREGMGRLAPALDARLAGHHADEAAIVWAEGRSLWPHAAALLSRAPVPADWTDGTGLSVADHAPIVATVAYVLDQAAALHALAEPTPEPDPKVTLPALLTATLAQPQAGDTAALATLLAAMLQRLLQADAVLDAMELLESNEQRATMRAARDLAIGFVSHRLRDARALSPNLNEATRELRRAARLIGGLLEWSRARPQHRAPIEDVQRHLAAQCWRGFSAALDALRVPPPAGGEAAASTAAVEGLEQSVRDVRRFEQVARKLGNAHHYDRALGEAAGRLAGQAAGALRFADRVRLLELLVGSDEAMGLAQARA